MHSPAAEASGPPVNVRDCDPDSGECLDVTMYCNALECHAYGHGYKYDLTAPDDLVINWFVDYQPSGAPAYYWESLVWDAENPCEFTSTCNFDWRSQGVLAPGEYRVCAGIAPWWAVSPNHFVCATDSVSAK
jgi:hypothetical protein